EQPDAVDPRHDHVGDDHRWTEGGGTLERVFAIHALLDFIAPHREERGEPAPPGLIVVGDQDPMLHGLFPFVGKCARFKWRTVGPPGCNRYARRLLLQAHARFSFSRPWIRPQGL